MNESLSHSYSRRSNRSTVVSAQAILGGVILMACVGLANVVKAADPNVSDTFAFTSNFGPNSAGFITGHRLQLGAIVSDSGGVPGNIAFVGAVGLPPYNPSTFTLQFFNIGPIFEGLYEIPATPYTGEQGSWEIRATNNDIPGATGTATTHVLDKPHLIPLASNVQIMENGTTPTVTWDEVLFDHDLNPSTTGMPVDFYRVRILNSASDQFFRSAPFQSPSFTVPVGLLDFLEPGEGVFFRIVANDIDDLEAYNPTENRSNTFTTIFIPITDSGIDVCPGSNLDFNVIIDGCDSGVGNAPLADGCTIADLTKNCADDVSNHGEFVSCVAHLTNELNSDGIISGQEKGKIQFCAAQAAIP